MDNKDIKGVRLGGLLVSAMVLLFFTVEAGAMVTDIRFDDNGGASGGTITYGGGTSVLMGTNIDINSITGSGTVLNSGTPIACQNCLLNFSTGAGSNTNPNGTAGTYTWASGGSFEITGGVSAMNIAAGTTLLEGTFTQDVTALVNGLFNIIAGFGSDTKNQTLLDYFGVAGPDFSFASTEIGADVTLDNPTGGFTATVSQVDVVNKPVPIPAAIWLFGSAMLGLIGIKRFGDRERRGMALAA